MILYHGTNVDFDRIDLNKSMRFKDFGKGFYLTDIHSQAVEMANRRVRIDGGSPVVQTYRIDEQSDAFRNLSILRFEKPTAQWAEFIFKNRSKALRFQHNFDIVYGPIADDGVAYLLSLYEDGLRTLDELAKELQFKRLNNQYCFETESSVCLLQRIFP